MNNKKQIPAVPFVDLSAQYMSLEAEVNQAISKVLHKTDFILGQDVSIFEEQFASFCQAKHGIGVDSGTSALELALKAYDIGPGDEVITAANTFIATVLAISFTGATPVLVDIDPQTYVLDPALVAEAITPQTKAILPVHLYGHPADMDPIMAIAEQYGLIVIEDASQAHGARYKGQPVGTLGHSAAFSLYPAKNLGGYGDGGIVVTNDENVAKTIKMLRNYGQSEKYHHILRGYNRRLDTLQAAVLQVKLQHLNQWSNARRQNAQLYREFLASSPVVLPMEADHAESVFHLYVIRTENREQLIAYLNSRGIATGIHYPIPIHLQPAYQDLGYQPGDFPVTEYYADHILSLPMYPELTPGMINYVATAIKQFASEYALESLAPLSIGK